MAAGTENELMGAQAAKIPGKGSKPSEAAGRTGEPGWVGALSSIFFSLNYSMIQLWKQAWLGDKYIDY